MIKLDNFSIVFIILNFFILIYLTVFNLNVIILFPLILLLSGLMLMLVVQRLPLQEGYDEDLEIYETETFEAFQRDALFSLLGFVMILSISFFVPIFKTTSFFSIAQTNISDTTKLIFFSVSMAISEEVFFRGFLLNWLANINNTIANILQALLFSVYHFAVYGQSISLLIYVFLAGLILGYMALRTGSLTTSILIHILVNIFSVI